MVRVEVKFIGSDRIGRYIATGKIGIGISVKWRIGATLLSLFDYDDDFDRLHNCLFCCIIIMMNYIKHICSLLYL